MLVHPTFPVGERDTAPTPTGRTIVEFLNGRIPGFVDTALNVAHVDDVARGHVLAAQRGALGRSYILGGENMSLQQMLTTLADVCGLPTPRIRVSPHVVLPVVRGAEWFQSAVLHSEPTLPSEPVRMATTRMEYDTSRARAELGYTSMPARAALRRAAALVRRQRSRQGCAGRARSDRAGQACTARSRIRSHRDPKESATSR